jgi:hypothetical protein
MPPFPRPDLADLTLKFIGLAAAGGSAAFAISMMNAPSTPRIQGMEHLAIYARPAGRSPETRPRRAREIDSTPVTSIRRSGPSLVGYEILSASSESAVLRLPEGRVVRISQGARIAGLGEIVAIEQRGASWTIVTQAGVIR